VVSGAVASPVVSPACRRASMHPDPDPTHTASARQSRVRALPQVKLVILVPQLVAQPIPHLQAP
ncbi:MAG TPA: hypothetical protein PK095_22615, partial [Myxococcota bacterium]|nr:hypothetical protein [Myxococcota bacterium]